MTLEKSLYFNRIALADHELSVNNLGRVDQPPRRMPARPARLGMELPETGTIRIPPVICRAGTQVVDVAFSPDGLRLATAQLDGTAVIWDAITGKTRHVFPPRRPGRRLQPRRLASRREQLQRDHDLGRDDRATDRLLKTIGRVNGWSVEFSPDGRLLAVPCQGGRRKIRPS